MHGSRVPVHLMPRRWLLIGNGVVWLYVCTGIYTLIILFNVVYGLPSALDAGAWPWYLQALLFGSCLATHLRWRWAQGRRAGGRGEEEPYA